MPFERVLLGGKSTQWAPEFLLGKLSLAARSASLWLAVATLLLLLLATGPWGRRAVATGSCWTEQHCAGCPQMWGQGQKGTFRDGKSRGGRKELVVLPLMLLALNKWLLVLQLPVL